MLVCAVAPALIFYVLLRPVNRNIALLAVFFNLVSIAIEGIARASLDPKFGRLVSSQRLMGKSAHVTIEKSNRVAALIEPDELTARVH